MNIEALRESCRKLVRDEGLSLRRLADETDCAFATVKRFVEGAYTPGRGDTIFRLSEFVRRRPSSSPRPDGEAGSWPVRASLERKLVGEYEGCALTEEGLDRDAAGIPREVESVGDVFRARPPHVRALDGPPPADGWLDNFRPPQRFLAAAKGVARDDYAPDVASLAGIGRPITVSMPAIEIGAGAAVMAMRRNDLYQGLEFRLDCRAENGADHMGAVNRGEEPLFLVTGVAAAAHAMRGNRPASRYQLVSPVHHISQALVSRAKGLRDVKRVYVCSQGAAVFHAAAVEGHGLIPARVERIYAGRTSPLSVAQKVGPDEAVICYEPVSQEFHLQRGMYTLEGTRRRLYVGLFAHKDLLRGKGHTNANVRGVLAFVQAFAAAYAGGRDAPRSAIELLMSDESIVRAYSAAAGVAPGQ